MGLSCLLLGQYDEALGRFKRSIERAPHGPAYLFLAWTNIELNRLSDANDAIKTVLDMNPLYTLKDVERIYPFRLDEDRDRFLDSLRKAGLPEG